MKKKRKLKVILIVLSLIICLTLVMLSPVFSIKNINVSGVNDSDSAFISDFLNNYKGENGILFLLKNITGFKSIDSLFSLRAEKTEKELLFNLPSLKDVTVKFKFPGSLEVSGNERKQVFYYSLAGQYICCDENAYVIKAVSAEDKLDLPLIEGINVNEYKAGTRLTEDVNILKIIKELFDEIKILDDFNDDYQLAKNIDIINFTEYNNIRLTIGESLTVKLGDTENLRFKLAMLKEICKDSTLVGNHTLDFTVADRPVLT